MQVFLPFFGIGIGRCSCSNFRASTALILALRRSRYSISMMEDLTVMKSHENAYDSGLLWGQGFVLCWPSREPDAHSYGVEKPPTFSPCQGTVKVSPIVEVSSANITVLCSY